ncbi:MAG: VWA domain-containing protein [Planctomycetaceae bacterium]|nr:VWA domain-containing protein [Planctomycetaceae bacterium]
MIRFLYPELFLLAFPLWFVFRRWGWTQGVTGALRVAILAVLLLALTGPQINLGGEGIDVVVVADRSRSLPAEAEASIFELIRNLQSNRRAGDRVAVVTFGTTPARETYLSNDGLLKEFQKPIQPDGSDLNEALHMALDLVDSRRPARVLVFSDGEANGASPAAAARRARDLGVPVDFREFPRARTGDVAVDSLLLPETVTPREPFQYTVWVYSDRETTGKVTVLRDGEPIARDQSDRPFTQGMNRLLFRDLLEEGGLHAYEVRLEVAGDPLVENNRGAGVVRVDAGPRLLVLNADGQPDNFIRALQAGNIPVDVAMAKQHPLTPDSLDRYRAIVLENVPAADFGRIKMERLAQFVEDLGGGLLLTGGERSFGNGGYFKSPLDDVLPVSMEMREEHRKTRLAMAIALDRSGSMAVTVKGGRPKMDLANLGTVEAIKMLSPGDSVAVIAVDSAPHVIQKLTAVEDTKSITDRVLKIESMGGGIFVYEALVAAGKQLMDAEQSTKHIILFSDANDSEEPGDYAKLLAQFEKAGITTSVIGLGKPTDVDSKLLEDVAKLGKGNIMFTEDAEELPRLFTQDTMSVARSSFVKKDSQTQPDGIPARTTPAAQLMGEFAAGAFPSADGYNLSYLKPDATLGVVSEDEYAAPWSAFWYRGLGRVVALTVEVDGQYSGAFGRWDDYADFAITHARWLLGGDSPDDVYLKIDRDGQDAVVTLELDPDRPAKRGGDSPTLSVVTPASEREATLDIPFQWTGPHTLQSRFKLTRDGTFRTLVKLGGRNIVRGPAVTLPYSPEFMPRVGLPSGRGVLEAVGRLSGGRERIDVLDVLTDPPRSARTTLLLPWLIVTALGLLLFEIAGRRLSLWTKLADAVESLQRPAEATATAASRRRWMLSRRPATGARAATAASPKPAIAGESRAQPAPLPLAAPAATADAIFEQAKRRAKKRLNE